MTEPHFSVALPARDVERAGIAARIGPWMGVSAASWPALEVLRSSARPILADDGRFVLWGPQPGGGVP